MIFDKSFTLLISIFNLLNSHEIIISNTVAITSLKLRISFKFGFKYYLGIFPYLWILRH